MKLTRQQQADFSHRLKQESPLDESKLIGILIDAIYGTIKENIVPKE